MRLKQTKTKTKESQMQNGAQILSFKNNNPIAELKSIREQLKAFQEREGDLKAQINNLLDQAGVEELVIGNDKVVFTPYNVFYCYAGNGDYRHIVSPVVILVINKHVVINWRRPRVIFGIKQSSLVPRIAAVVCNAV